MKILRNWLKKIIHECLDERFGCDHLYAKHDENGFKKCTKCGRQEYDAMWVTIKKIMDDGVKIR